jgi:hypothetical protein
VHLRQHGWVSRKRRVTRLDGTQEIDDQLRQVSFEFSIPLADIPILNRLHAFPADGRIERDQVGYPRFGRIAADLTAGIGDGRLIFPRTTPGDPARPRSYPRFDPI